MSDFRLKRSRFRWNDWNIEHIGRHDVDYLEAEHIVEKGDRRRMGDDSYKAIGQLPDGDWLQVIYIFDPPGVVYVIHARRLTDTEKRRIRKQRR
jgi:uncharacterized DUF497 family protein